MDENNSPRKKKRRLSLSLSKNRERFSVCTAEDVEAASKKKVPKNTLTAVNWAFRVFEDWVTHSSYVDGRCYKVEYLWSHEDPSKLCEMLACFCLEVKQQNGNHYTPKSVLQMLINLQKYAHERNIVIVSR